MLQAYNEGKDLYVEIASISFHRAYKLCLEHFPAGCPIKQHEDGKWDYALLKTGEDDGRADFKDLDYSNINPDDYDYDKLADGETDTYKVGKGYRGQAKKILLGIMYGRGEKSIAEQLGCEVEEARQIKENVYEAFPRIKVFEQESSDMVKQYGFVTTLWGRFRRLPDYNLPKYEVYYTDSNDPKNYNRLTHRLVPEVFKEQYIKKYETVSWRDREKFVEDLIVKENVEFIDNSSKIARAGRQIINSRVQGSAADMSKLALLKIRNDPELISRGVRVIIPVHDEILIETPLRYADYVKYRFAEDMETAAKPVLTIPVKCDVVSANGWYHDELDLDTELSGLPTVS